MEIVREPDRPTAECCAQQSRCYDLRCEFHLDTKDPPVAAGKSLAAVHPLPNGSFRIEPRRPPIRCKHLAPILRDVRYSSGCWDKNAQIFRPIRDFQSTKPRSNIWVRRERKSPGSGIFTGQTSSHRPFRVQALGRFAAFCSPTKSGVQTDPIGPG